ncbi:MAG: hypothetical protein HN842_00565 [Gammaproteobacteria bacterium]|nr:hypothetical protein [Gammaproteobacteria bacterium]
MPTLDPLTNLVDEHFAVVYTPTQRRKRFPESCVQRVESAEVALQTAAACENSHAASVIGPARSSEGLRLYYLVRWL